MSAPVPPPALPAETAPAPGGQVRSRTSMIRLSAALAIGGIGWIVPFSASTAVLLPARLAELDDANKVSLLAAATIIGSILALVGNVLFGALSDRTRSRFGRRNPWLVGGGVAAAVFLVLLSTAPNVPMLLLWWALYQGAQNAILAVLVAMLPDRVPSARRGTVSAVYGVGVLIGGAVGAAAGAAFVTAPATGFLVLALVVLVLPLTAAVLAPDFSSLDQQNRRLSGRELLHTFAFPRRAPDFYWALFGRLLIVLGYYMVSGYQLYILTDYMHLSETDAASQITFNAIVMLIACLLAAGIAGPLSDRLRRRKVIVIVASVLMGIGAAVPFLAAEPWTMTVFAALGGFGLGVYSSVDAALMSEVLPNDETRGKDLGILNMANTGGQVLAPSAAALVIGFGLGFGPIFLVALTVSVLGAAAIIPIKSVR